MAEALFRWHLPRWAVDASAWTVASAGTRAFAGQPAATNAQTVLAQRGLDLARHRSTAVESAILEQVSLILTMEPHHAAQLQQKYPQHAARIFVLGDLCPGGKPVLDPYGGDAAAYETALRQIEALIECAGKEIVSRAQTLFLAGAPNIS